MKQDVVIVPNDMDYIKVHCTEEIAKFGEQIEVMYQMYDAMGMFYPEECRTNYRDSWFHYRKLCKKKDVIAIYNEKYGLEEHLLRAVKDAQICFLQQLGYFLDIWYQHEIFLECDMSKSVEYERMYANMTGNWVQNIQKLSAGDEKLFANACLYRFIKYIETEEVKRKLQTLIHSIKNLILELRLEGVDILRPTDNMLYFERCVNMCGKMCSALEVIGIRYLLSSTLSILSICEK